MGSLSGALYIGVTSNFQKRAFQHEFHLLEGFTSKYEVERLLYWESYDDVHKAIGREKQLKGWSRAKKIALIETTNPQWLDLARDWYPWMKEGAAGRDASTRHAGLNCPALLAQHDNVGGFEEVLSSPLVVHSKLKPGIRREQLSHFPQPLGHGCGRQQRIVTLAQVVVIHVDKKRQ